MFTLSAFADEIDAEPARQFDALRSCGVPCVELRSAFGVNVLDLSNAQVDAVSADLDSYGLTISAIGSPIGKSAVDGPLDRQLAKLHRAIGLAQRFGTPNVRVFSFYPPAGETEPVWSHYRLEVARRLGVLARCAEAAGVRLLHENEHRIYGDSAERVLDLLRAVDNPALALAFDPANFIVCGYDPWDAWLKLREHVVHFHIKDWVNGESHGRVAGVGQGRLRDILADAVRRGYDGYAVLEPHLLGGGPTGGVTGPELFPKAVAALRAILCEVGGTERTV